MAFDSHLFLFDIYHRALLLANTPEGKKLNVPPHDDDNYLFFKEDENNNKKQTAYMAI